jgi:hypothetical protein
MYIVYLLTQLFLLFLILWFTGERKEEVSSILMEHLNLQHEGCTNYTRDGRIDLEKRECFLSS